MHASDGPRRPAGDRRRHRPPARSELDEWGPAEFLLEWESFAECVELYADWEMDGGLVDDPDAGTETDEE